MHILRQLLLGALGGGVFGWLVCAGFYLHPSRARFRSGTDLGVDWLNDSVSESFWPRTTYLALAGALIGAGIEAVNIIR